MPTIGPRTLYHSQKTMPKKTATEIGCGFFDQPDLQQLNDYKFFFSFCDFNFKDIWGV